MSTKTDKTEKAAGTEVAVAPTNAVALPAAALAMMAQAKPTDDFKANDLLIPWLKLVQANSGYVKKSHEEYIPGASEGDITDTLSKKLRSSVQVILCKFETHYSEWKPGGGKLVKQWFADPTGYNAAGNDFGIRLTTEGNEIKPAATYYILLLDPETGAATPMVWSLGGTQVKKSRRINSLARADLIGPDGLPFVPPIYARIFDLTSKGEAGDEGKTWAGWVAEPGSLVLANEKFGAMWWAKAQAFRDQIEKGNVRPMPPSEDAEVDEEAPQGGYRAAGGNAEPQRSGIKTLNDDIPF